MRIAIARIIRHSEAGPWHPRVSLRTRTEKPGHRAWDLLRYGSASCAAVNALGGASLNHPHICTLHDVGSQGGIDFLMMEHLEGETLAQRLTKGALPLEQALQTATQIADALDKAHPQVRRACSITRIAAVSTPVRPSSGCSRTMASAVR